MVENQYTVCIHTYNTQVLFDGHRNRLLSWGWGGVLVCWSDAIIAWPTRFSLATLSRQTPVIICSAEFIASLTRSVYKSAFSFKNSYISFIFFIRDHRPIVHVSN